jgi:hypothetical protein
MYFPMVESYGVMANVKAEINARKEMDREEKLLSRAVASIPAIYSTVSHFFVLPVELFDGTYEEPEKAQMDFVIDQVLGHEFTRNIEGGHKVAKQILREGWIQAMQHECFKQGDIVDGSFDQMTRQLRDNGVNVTNKESVDLFGQIQEEAINTVNLTQFGHQALIRLGLEEE